MNWECLKYDVFYRTQIAQFCQDGNLIGGRMMIY